jgi:hypothetical protein
MLVVALYNGSGTLEGSHVLKLRQAFDLSFTTTKRDVMKRMETGDYSTLW